MCYLKNILVIFCYLKTHTHTHTRSAHPQYYVLLEKYTSYLLSSQNTHTHVQHALNTVLLEKYTSYLLLLSQNTHTHTFSTFQMGRRKSPLRLPGGFWWLRLCLSSRLSCLNSTNVYWTLGAEEERWFNDPALKSLPFSISRGDGPEHSHTTMGWACTTQPRNTNTWGNRWEPSWQTPAARRIHPQASPRCIQRRASRREVSQRQPRWLPSPKATACLDERSLGFEERSEQGSTWGRHQ